jgi:Ca2+-binding RTX toxin-like protein
VPFTATVYSYSDSGARSPVAGALVTGADLPTAADGTTAVQLTRTVSLQALHGVDIPSNQAIVACVPSTQSACGPAEKVARHKIIGTSGADSIKGSPAPDLIRARGGNDRINTVGGQSDVVNCGRGIDRAVVDSTDITRRCEKVIVKR